MKPPKAVTKFMEEFEEAEQDVREYIVRQLGYYASIPDKANSSPAQWVAFKLGCSTAAAVPAINWATKLDMGTPYRKDTAKEGK